MRRTEIVAAVPAVGASLLPTLSCPACWPAYASMLASVGLPFLAESKYLLWLNAAALLVGLAVLLRRARTSSYRPLLVAAIASAVILIGKFGVASKPITWLGAAALLAAFVWSGLTPNCPQCVTKPLEVPSHGNQKS